MFNAQKYCQILINISIFCFFTLLLVFPKGYNYGSTVLLVASILFLFYAIYKKVNIKEIIKQNKSIFITVIFYFAVSLFFVLFHKEKLNLIDNPLRAFLFLSVIIFVAYNSVKFEVLLYSIPLGAFIAGLVAIYQYYVLHLPSAFYEQMKIQSGDMAMSLGLFSFITSFYLYEIKKNIFAILSIFAGLFGVLASELSFARGGWIGIPFIFFVVLYLYKQIISKKLLGVIFLGIIVATIVLMANEQFVDRVLSAKNSFFDYFNGVKDGSIGARLDMWKIGIHAFIEHPFSGWSLKELQDYKLELVQSGIISQEFTVFSHLHNQFIDDLAKKGIFGGLAILGIFLTPLYSFFKKYKNSIGDKRVKFITTLGIAHVLSTISYCLTQSFIAHNSGNVFYFFILSMLYVLMNNEEQGKNGISTVLSNL